MGDAGQPAPTPEECREVAAELRRMAEGARLPELRDELLDLAWRFERMAICLRPVWNPRRPRETSRCPAPADHLRGSGVSQPLQPQGKERRRVEVISTPLPLG